MFCQNASVASLAEEWRFRLLPDRSNLHKLFENANPVPRLDRRVETGERTGVLLLVDQHRVKTRLQR